MKTLQFRVRDKEVTFFYVDDKDNKTYVCAFLYGEINQDNSDDIILNDLKKIDKLKYEISQLSNSEEKEKEITQILFKYANCWIEPIIWGFFDTEVWSDSRSRLYMHESNYLDEQMTIVAAMSKFYEYIELEYKMNFNY